MAVQTIMKEYHADNSGENTGYDALVADLTAWYDWDEIDTSDATSTLFKKYQPGSTNHWAGLKVTKSIVTMGLTLRACSHNGTTLYATNPLYGSSSVVLRYTAAVLTDKGFFVQAGNYMFPNAAAAFSYSYFGMADCTNKITGGKGVCAIAAQNIGALAIMSSSTCMGSFVSSAYPIAGAGCDFVFHSPLVSCYAKEVPDDVLRLIIRPDTKQACLEHVTLDGKPYVRLGDLLIPE